MAKITCSSCGGKGFIYKKDEKGEDFYRAGQWQLVWWKFKRHRLANIGAIVLAVFYFFAIFAGFMAPYDLLDDMSRFMLMPSYVGCHFCKPPALNQVLYVEQSGSAGSKGKPQFIHEPIRVTGTLRLFSTESEHPAHLAEFVYALDDARIEVLDGKDALERAQAVHTRTGKENPAHDALQSPGSSSEGE